MLINLEYYLTYGSRILADYKKLGKTPNVLMGVLDLEGPKPFPLKEGKLNDEGKKEAGETPETEKSEAAQLAVFPETPAAPSGNITPDAAIQGLKIDEKLERQQQKSAIKNPGLQSAGFDPKA